eukprot:TRINITY_DN349_c0_g1_i1.p1 TRINITY_DN349_c0_g1~~TRINITY_DN349_c0_g1_i1.p1  ORF type:complete len:345 (-),score=96.15 TRINITY_DN349_c0_g1_i1:43-1077(-)
MSVETVTFQTLSQQTSPEQQDSSFTHEAKHKSPPSSPERKAGRRKIAIEYIDDKSRRHITFSKRKAGIMKKAYELSTLTGTQVLLLVASETGHVYTFATPKLQALITKPEGKNLIQSCLNAPDTTTSSSSSSSSSASSLSSSSSNLQNNMVQQSRHHNYPPVAPESPSMYGGDYYPEEKPLIIKDSGKFSPMPHHSQYHQPYPQLHELGGGGYSSTPSSNPASFSNQSLPTLSSGSISSPYPPFGMRSPYPFSQGPPPSLPPSSSSLSSGRYPSLPQQYPSSPSGNSYYQQQQQQQQQQPPSASGHGPGSAPFWPSLRNPLESKSSPLSSLDHYSSVPAGTKGV